MKTIVIMNPAAANGRVAKRLKPLISALREIATDHELVTTQRPHHATELAREAVMNGYERVFSVGGDGTHNEVINGLMAGKQPLNPDVCLGIVPFGTGTDFSRTLGIPRGAAAIARLTQACPIAIDVGYVTYGQSSGREATRCFVNVADFGAGGAVVRRVNATTKFFGGFASFLYGAAATLLIYKNPWMHLEIGGESIEGRLNNVIVAKGQYYGGGMHAAPEARLDSGRFEVFVIGDVGRIEAILNLPKLYRGRLMERADKVSHYPAERIVARSSEQVLLNLDGEQPGQLPATFEILPKAIKVLV